jgi:hypothetical protein
MSYLTWMFGVRMRKEYCQGLKYPTHPSWWDKLNPPAGHSRPDQPPCGAKPTHLVGTSVHTTGVVSDILSANDSIDADSMSEVRVMSEACPQYI